jgi:D-3-phosphoglycerate dehydrogenase
MTKVLVGYPLDKHKVFEDLLKSLSAEHSLTIKDYSYEWLGRHAHEFDIIITSLKVVIDDAIVDNAEKLRLIFTPTTGRDHIRIVKNAKRVEVLTLNDYREEIQFINSTAELGFGLMLALSRKLMLACNDVVGRGEWERNNFLGRELNGQKMGIVGMGRIGRKIAGYGEAFGMEVIYWDKAKRKRWKKIPRLEELLSLSDFIIVSVTLSDSTQHLINMDNISRVRKGAVLVNISRGKVLEEKAICRALRQGVLSGVGVDVLESELQDFTKSPLYQYARKNPLANVIITPHIGGATIDAWQRVFKLVFDKILEKRY